MTPETNPDPRPPLSHVLGQISFHHAGAAHYVRLDRRMHEWSQEMERKWRGELEQWYPDAVEEAVPPIRKITESDFKALAAGDAGDRWE